MIENFSLPTLEALTTLNGDMQWPDDAKQPVGAVVIVPGGWFAERDGFMGDSYTEADLMYLRLARRIIAAGFVAARFDNRGVQGNEFTIGITKESEDPETDTRRYLQSCVNSEVRRSVTPETLVSDVASVYHFVALHPRVDSENIVMFTHSEGGIHVARAINQHAIQPRGVVFAGVTTFSPVDTVRWQSVDRYVDEILRWNRCVDGRLTIAELENSYRSSWIAEAGVELDDLRPMIETWTESSLRQFFSDRYEREKARTMNTSDCEPFPPANAGQPSFIAASYRWYKQWYSDSTPLLAHLFDYSGKTTFHFGEIDRQINAPREVEHIESRSHALAIQPRIELHHQRGHAFGLQKPVAGPMDQGSEDRIAEDIIATLRAAR